MAVYISTLIGGNITVGSGGSSGHADTWYKYASDADWRTVSISGAISGGDGTPTTQIPNVENVVALEIGTGVTSIGKSAFENCSGLQRVTIGDGVNSIGDSAFFGCNGLESVTIPESVTSIGEWAFDGCAILTSMTIPDSVTSIGMGAFDGCSDLTSVTIGSGVNSIGQVAFMGCDSLTSVTFLGKTLAQVQAMSNYSWEISDTSIINVA